MLQTNKLWGTKVFLEYVTQ